MRINENFIAYKTILRKEIIRMLRIWPQTIFPPIITTTMYFIIFGKLIGDRIGGFHGFSYLQFIVPGLMMTTIINNAFSASSSAVYVAKFIRNIEEILVSPASNLAILLGFMSSGVMRATVIGGLVLLIASFFTPLTIHHPWLLILTLLFSSSLLALIGIINGLLAESFDDISWIPTFVLTPLTYLGGVFYPLSLLSAFWQKVSLINPVFYLIEAFRYSMLGTFDVNINITIMLLTGLLVGLFFWTLYILRTSPRLRD